MKYILIPFIALSIITNISYAQGSREEEEIAKTVQLYFEGMMERDKTKLDHAFLPEARLIGYRGDKLTITSFEDWSSGTAKGQPRDKAKFQNKLVSIRIVGNTAVAESELYWPGIYYYDYLTLIKVDGFWKIVHKSWTEKKID